MLPFIAWTAASISGCGMPNLAPKPVTLSDPSMAPILKAIGAVDRAKLGFTPVPLDVEVRVDTIDRAHWNRSYPPPVWDVMVHIYAATHRTIAFQKTADGLRWISEQETHFGPKDYTDQDGTRQEHLVVEYQTAPVNGVPLNQVCVSYSGRDPQLTGRELTLEQIKPVLEQWQGTPIR